SRQQSEAGSIIMVVATDAPLLTHQLKRLARRAAIGLARTGSISGNASGDIFVAFSTANRGASRHDRVVSVAMLPSDRMDRFFAGTAQGTEESIVNAMGGADTMTGIENRRVVGLPHERLRDVLRKYRRLSDGK